VAAVLRRGGLAAFPTETVYGLGADATDARAVAAVFEAKGRPPDNPLIVHVAGLDGVVAIADITPLARSLFEAFAPGPLTLVLPSRGVLPDAVTAGLGTVAVRVPALALARGLIEAAGVPLVAPSANRSGRPSPTTWEAVRDDLDGRIDAVLMGDPTTVGIESTVVDATGDVPVVLRPGAVTLADLQRVVPGAREAVPGVDDAARSPGTRHRHYAPRAPVHLLWGPPPPPLGAAYIGLEHAPPGYVLALSCRTVEEYAHALYDFFRRADAAGAVRIDAQPVPDVGLGRALMDRLRRAAEA
jgi:L-threonylcarbamoyladenylate synthase